MKFVVVWIVISALIVSVSSNSGRILATMAACVFVVVLVVLSILDILCLEKVRFLVVVEKD
jgi:hypothetical protein